MQIMKRAKELKCKHKNTDYREILECRLIESGIDSHKAFVIALDYGIGAVNRDYLIDMGLKGKKLTFAETCVKDFYWLH